MFRKFLHHGFTVRFVFFAIASFLMFPIEADAGSVSLTWQRPTTTATISGYKVYYGTSSRNYSTTIPVPNQTSLTISNSFDEGKTYYFALTALDSNGNESSYSNEASATMPNIIMPTVYEDAEAGDTEGWTVVSSTPGNVWNVYDAERNSNVIELDGFGLETLYRLADLGGGSWENRNQFVVQWSMQYAEFFDVAIEVATTAGTRFLNYRPADISPLGSGMYVVNGLGSNAIDGQWHTFTRDLQADLHAAQPGVDILEVKRFYIRGSGRIDDIKLMAAVTVYEDGEDGSTIGWSVVGSTSGSIWNVYDADRNSNVIELDGDGLNGLYRLTNADGSTWNNRNQFVVQWSMQYAEFFDVAIEMVTTAGARFLNYRPTDISPLGIGTYVVNGLGSNASDGQWHTFTRDLQADLHAAQPGVDIIEVRSFYIRGSGRVDDVKLLAVFPGGLRAVYEDGEDGSTIGWSAVGSTPGSIWNVYDADRNSNVIELDGDGLSGLYRLANSDGSTWNNRNQFVVQWSMQYAEFFDVAIEMVTTAGTRFLNYRPTDISPLGIGTYVVNGLGSNASDGQWHTFTRDLQADLHAAQPGVDIVEVRSFYIRGSGRVDDIMLIGK